MCSHYITKTFFVDRYLKVVCLDVSVTVMCLSETRFEGAMNEKAWRGACFIHSVVAMCVR